MALMVWIWTGSILELVEVHLRTSRGSLCSARWGNRSISAKHHLFIDCYSRYNKHCGLILQELFAAYEAEAAATGNSQLMLTAAVAAGKGTIDAGYEVAEIAK